MTLHKSGYRIDSLNDSGEDENCTVVTSKNNLKLKSEKERNSISSDDQIKMAKKSANTQLQPIVLQASNKTEKFAFFSRMVIDRCLRKFIDQKSFANLLEITI